MLDFFSRLFDTTDFPPRWRCGNWTAGEGWLHILSDLGVWSAYVAIPCVLGYFLLRRADLPFRRVMLLFGAFILACGTTHLMEAIIFWWPAYRLAGLIKLGTAVVSWATVVALIRVVPVVLTLRSPDELAREVTARRAAEAALRQANADLEQRVAARTAELVAANGALRESEERLRTLSDNLSRGAVYQAAVDPDGRGRFAYFSAGVERLFGITPDEIARDPAALYALIHEDDQARMAAEEAAALQTLTPFDCVFRHRTRAGEVLWVHCRSAPRRLADGRAVWDGVILDVTARKLAEDALRESEQQFRTLADSIPQLAWSARPDGHIEWYNRRWYEFTGTTPAEMGGWGWQAVHDPAELPAILARWRASIASGEPFEMTFPLRGAGGRYRWFLTRVVPLRSPDGSVLRWFGTNTDVTEIRAMEAALKAADRAKDEYLAMLAHELRNPLAPLLNTTQLLRHAGADPQIRADALDRVERQVRHLSRLVDDLLEASRVAHGRVTLRPERVDLGRLVRAAADDRRAAADRGRLALTADVPQTPVWVSGDPIRLTQAIANLLDNAAKYTDPGGRIDVRLRAAGGAAVLTIRDTGIGIPAAVLPRLFTAFTQADATLDRAGGGLGLGLSVVKGLVGLHGGTVRAASGGPGQGAEFTVELPLIPEPAALSVAPPGGPTGAARRVVVIEDNVDAAESLKVLLEVFGHEVRVAHTGPEGVRVASGWIPDVVVSDIGLPGLDGYGVARELRLRPATARVRLVALTGYGADEDRRRAAAAGFDHLLTKPADPAVLEALVVG